MALIHYTHKMPWLLYAPVEQERNEMTLTTANCPRCGRLISTAVTSLLRLDALKREYGTLCQHCITPAEHYALLREMGRQLSKGTTSK